MPSSSPLTAGSASKPGSERVVPRPAKRSERKRVRSVVGEVEAAFERVGGVPRILQLVAACLQQALDLGVIRRLLLGKTILQQRKRPGE